MKRSLSLKRETLAELTAEDLVAVAGAAEAITVNGLTCPIRDCVPTMRESCNITNTC